jgi:hypothetical protein
MFKYKKLKYTHSKNLIYNKIIIFKMTDHRENNIKRIMKFCHILTSVIPLIEVKKIAEEKKVEEIDFNIKVTFLNDLYHIINKVSLERGRVKTCPILGIPSPIENFIKLDMAQLKKWISHVKNNPFLNKFMVFVSIFEELIDKNLIDGIIMSSNAAFLSDFGNTLNKSIVECKINVKSAEEFIEQYKKEIGLNGEYLYINYTRSLNTGYTKCNICYILYAVMDLTGNKNGLKSKCISCRKYNNVTNFCTSIFSQKELPAYNYTCVQGHKMVVGILSQYVTCPICSYKMEPPIIVQKQNVPFIQFLLGDTDYYSNITVVSKLFGIPFNIIYKSLVKALNCDRAPDPIMAMRKKTIKSIYQANKIATRMYNHIMKEIYENEFVINEWPKPMETYNDLKFSDNNDYGCIINGLDIIYYFNEIITFI